jgi:hypothetical protein
MFADRLKARLLHQGGKAISGLEGDGADFHPVVLARSAAEGSGRWTLAPTQASRTRLEIFRVGDAV